MAEPILIEVAVESVACALAAVGAGADRLELCADLASGGVTPSAGMIRAVREAVDVPIVVLIRPRPGDFVCSATELAVMRHDIREARRTGVNGVAFGALTVDHRLDIDAMRLLVGAAGSLECVMHRGVDQALDVMEAARSLIACGVKRVLTSGGAVSALAGAGPIAALVAEVGTSIEIMAGGKVRSTNVGEILGRTGVRAVHAGPRTRLSAAGMGDREVLDLGQLVELVRTIREIEEER
ncbi:MAG: copper homeostasis protein CutC [Gemmatimonadales bacterium]